MKQLRKDVPSIRYIQTRVPYVLQEVSPQETDNISTIVNNPYLDLDGNGVIVGIVDTGIDYLNKEFMREDDTSRILTIWDQKSTKKPNDSVYVGSIFNNEDINNAIKSKADGRDPYDIVDSRDEIWHGTKLASIIGARGYNRKIKVNAKDTSASVEAGSDAITVTVGEPTKVTGKDGVTVTTVTNYKVDLSQKTKDEIKNAGGRGLT